MKKRLMGAVLGFALLCLPNIVIAANSCSYSEQAELNEIAANVKTNYEVIDIFKGKSTNPDAYNQPEIDVYVKGLKVNILNITDDIYISVTNNSTNEVRNYTSSDAINGIITFEHADVEQMYTYKIDIYANKYSCSGELIRTYDFVTPLYNFYSGLEICSTYPDFYYCQEFLATENNISYDEFLGRIEELREEEPEEEKKEKEKSFGEKIKEFYKNNEITILIIGGIIVVGGITTTVILVKKRRSRVL